MNSPSRPLPIKKVVRDYRSLDFNLIREYINSNELTDYNKITKLNSNECVKLYNTEISNIINSNCPVNTRIFKHDKSKRWFDSNLHQLKKKKRQTERKLRKSPYNSNYSDEYRKARNQYTMAIKEARTNFFSNKSCQIFIKL